MEKYEINKALESFKESISDLKIALNLEKLNKDLALLLEKTSNPNIWDDPKNAKEQIDLMNQIKEKTSSFNKIEKNYDDLLELYSLYDTDTEIQNLIEEEVNSLEEEISSLEIKVTLNQKYDDYDAILELHPGQGGTEALDWAQMLYRMYSYYAQNHHLKLKVLNFEQGEVGIKSVSVSIKGKYAYGLLKGERGVHRLVRISPFDSNKRRHTTFVSCDVAPLIPETENVTINEEELKIDTYCSSGPGGQGVNTTYSAVRITHLPTGIVVSCQNERSQIKNKEICLRVLKSKLLELEIQKKDEELRKIKGEQMEIGFGSQIRSYIFCPYTLVKDHRTGFEVTNIESVMNGNLDGFIKAYLKMIARENNEK